MLPLCISPEEIHPKIFRQTVTVADADKGWLRTKKEAKEVLIKIKEFLEKELKLQLNTKTQIFKDKQGVNFCGYKINENRLKIRDKGKRKLKRKIKSLKQKIKEGKITSKESKKYIAGHLGYIKIANTKNLIDKIFYTET